MSIYTVTEAAAHLGCTERTIWRKLRSGQLTRVERDGRMGVEIDGETPAERVSDIADNLSRVGAASAVARSRDADILSAVLSDARSSRRLAWTGTAVASLATVGALTVVALLAWTYHTDAVDHIRQVAGLERDRDEATERAAGLQIERDQLRQDAQQARSLVWWTMGLEPPPSDRDAADGTLASR